MKEKRCCVVVKMCREEELSMLFKKGSEASGLVRGTTWGDKSINFKCPPHVNDDRHPNMLVYIHTAKCISEVSTSHEQHLPYVK